MRLRFTGHAALLLGGTCDLALCLAESMMESGLHPCLTFRNQTGLNRIHTHLGKHADKYDTVYLDLGESESVDAAVSDMENHVDYWVDFAHGHFESLVGAGNPEKMKRYFEENVAARARALRRGARMFLEKKFGRLVYVSSAAVERANPGQGFYAASKLASEALYRNLGLELACHGITTVSLRLGYVDAGRGKAYLDKIGDIRSEASSRVSLTTPLTTKEVAETILFYLSESATGFNATTVTLDKGRGAAK